MLVEDIVTAIQPLRGEEGQSWMMMMTVIAINGCNVTPGTGCPSAPAAADCPSSSSSYCCMGHVLPLAGADHLCLCVQLQHHRLLLT